MVCHPEDLRAANFAKSSKLGCRPQSQAITANGRAILEMAFTEELESDAKKKYEQECCLEKS